MKKNCILKNQLMLLTAFLFGLISYGTDKPNLIVIMCDDLGYADVGFNGSLEIPTPGIDRIASEGIKFSSAYVSYPVCGPSRAGFITGRYGQRFGFERNPQYDPTDPNMGLPQEEMTLAESLSQVGYHSGIIGKWHLGAHPINHPLNRGFNEFFGHLGGGHRYFPEELSGQNIYEQMGEVESYHTRIVRDHKTVETSKYLTDEFSDEAVRFVSRNRDKPFFLFLSYNAPHLPLQATKKYLDRFASLTGKRKTYAAMVSAVDDGVVNLLETLDHLNLAENTIVFFLSDNGGPYLKNASRNDPLKGGKSDVWEGGFRVPMAVRWPAKFTAGMVYDAPILSLDIFGTIAGITGAPPNPGRPLDGVNLTPYLTGENDSLPHEAIYIRKFDQQRYALRYRDYKLVIIKSKNAPELYNLSDDISETIDIAKSNPLLVMKMENLRQKWTDELVEPSFLGLIHTKEWQNKKNKKK